MGTFIIFFALTNLLQISMSPNPNTNTNQGTSLLIKLNKCVQKEVILDDHASIVAILQLFLPCQDHSPIHIQCKDVFLGSVWGFPCKFFERMKS
jgi:hypothetical protein